MKMLDREVVQQIKGSNPLYNFSSYNKNSSNRCCFRVSNTLTKFPKQTNKKQKGLNKPMVNKRLGLFLLDFISSILRLFLGQPVVAPKANA